VSASLTCALFPGPGLAAASGLLFGPRPASPVADRGDARASCAFLISRRVGLGAGEQLAGPRVRRIRGWIGRRGFLSVLYARIIPGMPNALVNYAAAGAGRRRAAAARGQTSWIWSRLVVPGFPDGSPAVIPTRSPGFSQPSSTTRAAAAWTSSSVTS